MKQIPLSKGKAFALVDDDLYEDLSRYKWQLTHGYAIRHVEWPGKVGGKWKSISMHRHIMGAESIGKHFIDHIDRNPLNNQRANLRVCTPGGNAMNRSVAVTNTSGYKGVSWNKKCAKWSAQIQVNRKKFVIGLFDTPEDAYIAYCMKAKELHGEYAIDEVKAIADSVTDFVPYVKRTNQTGLKGVKYQDGKWRARIMRDGIRIDLGHFATPEEARAAYCKAKEGLDGEFAHLKEAA